MTWHSLVPIAAAGVAGKLYSSGTQGLADTIYQVMVFPKTSMLASEWYTGKPIATSSLCSVHVLVVYYHFTLI